MKLKYVAASKLLLSNWSIPKLDRVLEQTDIRLSRSLDFVSPNNIKVSCVQMALHNELPAKEPWRWFWAVSTALYPTAAS